MRAALYLVFVGCTSPSVGAQSRPATPVTHGGAACTPPPVGDPAKLTVPIGGATGIDPPQTCAQNGPNEAYLKIHGPGTRTFAIDPPGKATGCTAAPAPGAAAELCPTIDLNAFYAALRNELRSKGLEMAGWGIGACGPLPLKGGWEDSHWGITIYDWKDANTAVTVVADLLRTWGLGQSLEVAVNQIKCGGYE